MGEMVIYNNIYHSNCESHVAQRGDRSPMTSHPRTSLSIHYLSFHLSHYTSPSFASFVVTHVLTLAHQISPSFSLKSLSHPLLPILPPPSPLTLLSELPSPCNRTIRPPSTSSSDSRYRSISPPFLSSPYIPS